MSFSGRSDRLTFVLPGRELEPLEVAALMIHADGRVIFDAGDGAWQPIAANALWESLVATKDGWVKATLHGAARLQIGWGPVVGAETLSLELQRDGDVRRGHVRPLGTKPLVKLKDGWWSYRDGLADGSPRASGLLLAPALYLEGLALPAADGPRLRPSALV